MWKDAQEKASALLGEETVKAIMSSPAATLGKG
jgi:hypothetical protein